MRERGLKPKVLRIYLQVYMSLPMRERGLKQLPVLMVALMRCRSPCGSVDWNTNTASIMSAMLILRMTCGFSCRIGSTGNCWWSLLSRKRLRLWLDRMRRAIWRLKEDGLRICWWCWQYSGAVLHKVKTLLRRGWAQAAGETPTLPVAAQCYWRSGSATCAHRPVLGAIHLLVLMQIM